MMHRAPARTFLGEAPGDGRSGRDGVLGDRRKSPALAARATSSVESMSNTGLASGR
jgi:hypothetical protein